MWANGAFPCGDWPDLKIARKKYIHEVKKGEKTYADLGYRDKKYFIIPNPNNREFNKRHKFIMSRHETLNGRLKQFNILNERFRHSTYLHSRCFYAVLNLVQLSIENGEPLFDV